MRFAIVLFYRIKTGPFRVIFDHRLKSHPAAFLALPSCPQRQQNVFQLIGLTHDVVLVRTNVK